MVPTFRSVTRVVTAQATSDGAGVRLRRSLGTSQLGQLDPFLLLDEFKSDERDDYIAGFPDHPHRGFETVTYMLAGHMLHADHVGNRGDLVAGSVQWMTAGRGIVHSEMPQQEDGLLWGFQLWVNLPASHKMDPPRYQDIPPQQIPEVRTSGGAVIRVLAGHAHGATGPVEGIVTQPLYLDIQVPAGSQLTQEIAADHNAMCYAIDGVGHVGRTAQQMGTQVSAGQLAVLGSGTAVQIEAGEAPVRVLLIAGRPIGEPVFRYGPFVMNTREEIIQAFADFESGRLQA